MSDKGSIIDSIVVEGSAVVENVKRLVREGNVRRLVIKHEGTTLLEIPLSVGVIGALLMPTLAALGAMAALLTSCTIEVHREGAPEEEKKEEASGDKPPENQAP